MAAKSRSSRAGKAPLWFMGAGIFFIVSAVVFLSSRTARQAEPTPTFQALSAASIPRMSLDEAKAAFDQGEAVFVDVRGAEDFAAGHIAGALSISLRDIEAGSVELDRDDWIITYCT